MNEAVVEKMLREFESGADFDQDLKFALAKIIEIGGSTPRGSGAVILLKPDGETVGTIGGGPVENEVLATAETMFSEEEPDFRRLSFELDSEEIEKTGGICGGSVEVMIEIVKLTERSRDDEEVEN